MIAIGVFVWYCFNNVNLSKYRLDKELLTIFEHLTDEQKIETAIQKYPVKDKDVKNIFTYYELEQHPYAKKLILDKYKNSPRDLFRYARDMISGRWPEAEPIIMTDLLYAYYYSRDIIRGRWSEAEPIIMSSSEYAYLYALYIIKGRWPEAEPTIMTNPHYAYRYARYMIEGRWLEAEPIIMTYPEYAYFYSRDVIRGRWPEAEPTMKYTNYWPTYKNHFKL